MKKTAKPDLLLEKLRHFKDRAEKIDLDLDINSVEDGSMDPRAEMISLIGAGGKTTLISELAHLAVASGLRVIITTTMHMTRLADYELIETSALEAGSAGSDLQARTCANEGARPRTLEELFSVLRKKLNGGSCVQLGRLCEDDRKIAIPVRDVENRSDNYLDPAQELFFDQLKDVCDFVLIEADGAHGLPMKAHAAYEPLVPQASNEIIYLVGATAFGKPLQKVVHRPEIMVESLLWAGSDPLNLETVITPDLCHHWIAFEIAASRTPIASSVCLCQCDCADAEQVKAFLAGEILDELL